MKTSDKTPWVPAQVIGSWASTTGIRYRKVNGWVFVEGQLSTMGGSGTTAVYLPPGFRPGTETSSAQTTGSATYPAAVVVRPTGEIQPYYSAGTKVDLSISFPAEV